MNGSGLELLTTEQMAQADAAMIARGVTGLELMERAGDAVARMAVEMIPEAEPIDILCGPGNNGGDGYVAARLLQLSGYHVAVYAHGDPDKLSGDAATMAQRWSGPIRDLQHFSPNPNALVIDALFGAGLSRNVEGPLADTISHVAQSGCPVLSVDLPSGINGTTGALLGVAITATKTITFFRRKPGHLLYPGREKCGEITCVDIGIADDVINEIEFAPPQWSNAPDLWLSQFPKPKTHDHKYTRGHAVVVSGPPHMTGAARLGARAALRAGAGAVTVASRGNALLVNAMHLTAVMVDRINDAVELADILSDKRKTAALIGPGAGVGDATAANVTAALGADVSVVLDADALTSFTDAPHVLFSAIKNRSHKYATVLTPHSGEFQRLFGAVDGSRLAQAREAAARAGGIVILKGPDTVIAAPDGRAVINEDAPATLATAGSGDVLAGLITGLLAQGMPDFEAACAAVWLHGACARQFGPGLIAEDLAEMLPQVLASLLERGD